MRRLPLLLLLLCPATAGAQDISWPTLTGADNVRGQVSQLRSAVSTFADANGVLAQPNGTTRTVQRHLSDDLDERGLNVRNFGAQPGAMYPDAGCSFDSSPGFQAAMSAACASGGAEVVVPRGHFCLDTSAHAGVILGCSNLSLRGQGMGKSVIEFFAHPSGTHYTGVAIFVGVDGPYVSQAANAVTNDRLLDFTLQDKNPIAGGGAQSSILGTLADNFEISRVEAIDCKGAGCIASFGAYGGGQPLDYRLSITDNYIHTSTTGGPDGGAGWIEGDGINTGGGYNQTLIAGNRIYAPGRHAYEGDCENDCTFSGNFIDMSGSGGGLDAFGSVATVNGVFVGNTVKNLGAGHIAFSFINDSDNQGISKNLVQGNNVSCASGGGTCVFVHYAPRATTVELGPLQVTGNFFRGGQFALLYAVNVPIEIRGNVIDTQGTGYNGIVTGDGLISGAGQLVVENNSIVNASTSKLFSFSSDTAWKSSLVRFANNRVSGAADVWASVGSSFSGTLAANSSTTTFTTSAPGILAGDVVRATTNNAMPPGVLIQAWATADTINWAYVNVTSSSVSVPSHVVTFYGGR